MKLHIYSISWFVLVISTLNFADDTITIYNNTSYDLYMGVYYRYHKIPFLEQKPSILATDVCLIKAQEFVELERPGRMWQADRKLAFGPDKSVFKKSLNTQVLDTMNTKPVGNLQGNTFYLVTNSDGDINAHTAFEWNYIQKPIQDARDKIFTMLPAISQNPYKDQVASVRIGNQLCADENAYLQNRIAYIKSALENNLHINPQNVPTISVICSGGGFRAMLYTLGALKGLEQTGILDFTTYLVGLSGSTWAIGTWISSGLSLDVFHDWIVNNIGSKLNDFDNADFKLMGYTLLTKYCMGQPIGFVDIYGSFLANNLFTLFTQDKIMVHLSEQTQRVNDGTFPLPIYTAISGQNLAAQKLWYEFSPYEVGATWLDAYVPTWAFGRKFKNGVSVTNSPEQPMGTLLGTFGLAIGVTVKRMLAEASINPKKIHISLLKKFVNLFIATYGADRPISASYHNIAFGMKNRKFNTVPILEMVDGGINCNLPYVPVSGIRAARKSDILIFIDASSGQVGQELAQVHAFAQSHKLPFPQIDYSQITKRAFSVFKDDANADIPIVIYIPRVVDEQELGAHQADMPNFYTCLHGFNIDECILNEACNTFNFFYTPDQACQVTALGEFNVLVAQNSILESIQSLLN